MATDASSIRTIAITGQHGAGKTSLADAMLFAGGVVNRIGRVDDESSVFDFEPEEAKRRCTITSSFHHLPWGGREITIIDTPGQGNFVSEAHFILRGVGAALFVVDASSPLHAESSKVWDWIGEQNLPSIVVLNRIDRAECDVDGTVAALTDQLGMKVALLQLPITHAGGATSEATSGATGEASGIVDVLAGKALLFDGESGKFSSSDVPADLADRVEELRMEITELAAEGDDELLERYLEDGELSPEEVRRGLRAAVAAGDVAPVLCTSASANVGLPQLLDAIAELLPAPVELRAAAGVDDEGGETEIAPDPSGPVSAFVFKTLHDPHTGQLSIMRILSGTLGSDEHVVNLSNRGKERLSHLFRIEGKKHSEVKSATVGDIVAVAKLKTTHAGDTLGDAASALKAAPFAEVHPAISFAVEAKKRGDEDKVMQGLGKLCEEDRTLHVERDDESGEILLSGAGQLHVEVACERLERKYGAAVNLKAPKVAYRETVTRKVEGHGRLKKQSGGHGQFADCRITVEPLPAGSGFEFVDKIVGGSIPRGFIPAVEKGVIEAMRSGTVAGCPVVDVRVTLVDGQYHDVDSSEMAFKVAGSMAFKDGAAAAKPVLLEPYAHLDVSVPDDCMGDVMGDLNQRRAKVEGMEQRGANQCIKARAPMNEVLRYAPDLTSMTSGRGSFELSFSHSERAPQNVTAKVVEERGRAKSES